MSISQRKNIGAYLHAAYAADSTAVTAGGSGDAVAVAGTAVDRLAQGTPLSASIVYAIKATMANTKTLSLAYKVQSSVDSAFTVPVDLPGSVIASVVVLNAKSDGSAQTIVVKHDVDLNGALQYVRVNFTPDLSNTATDTATLIPVWVFGGMAELP